MNRFVPLLALTLLAACDRQESPAAPPASAEAPAPAPAAKAVVPSLEGQWQLKAPATLVLTLRDDQATLASGCLRRGFTFTQDRNKVAFTSNPAGSSNCGRSPSAAEEAAFAALGDANLAVFGADGTATLSGIGGMIGLEPR